MLLVWAGCDGAGSDTGMVTIRGTVTDGSGNAVPDARVQVEASEAIVDPQDADLSERTDSTGRYRLDVEIDTDTELTLSVDKDTQEDSRTVTVFIGQTRDDVDFVLGSEDSGGGNAVETDTTTLSGRVVNGRGDPIEDARVVAQPNEKTVSGQSLTVRTRANGEYTLDVKITASTELTVRAISDALQDEQILTVFPDETREGVNFVLGSGGGGEDGGGGGNGGGGDVEAGTPSNILLQDISQTTIGIQGSGAPEVARVTFQVADSAGRPVSLDNETPVNFKLGQNPGGEAFIAPEQATTNDNGIVTVNLSSGTVSGTVQIVASANTEDGGVIRSKPVTVTIVGGFPHEPHFSIGPESYNFQALTQYGLELPVSVIVGDQYSNPVKPGTAVYFETSHGVIEGSIETDEQGRGTVQLLSARPLPKNGVGTITASTANRDEERISVQTPVLFSGGGTVKVLSTPRRTFEEPLDLSDPADYSTLQQTLNGDFPFGSYEFRVEDRNGNPLPGGTTVSFTAGGTEVGQSGDTDVELGDTQFFDQNGDGDRFDYEDVRRGPGFTRFSASAVEEDDIETAEEPDLESITFGFNAPQSRGVFTLSEPDTTQQSRQVVMRRNGKPLATWENGRVETVQDW